MLYKQSGLKLALVLITASLLSACGNGKKELSEFTPIGATVSSSVAVDESSSTAIVVSSSSTTPVSSSLDASSSSEASIASVSSTATSDASQSSTSAPTVVDCSSVVNSKATGAEAYIATSNGCQFCHGVYDVDTGKAPGGISIPFDVNNLVSLGGDSLDVYLQKTMMRNRAGCKGDAACEAEARDITAFLLDESCGDAEASSSTPSVSVSSSSARSSSPAVSSVSSSVVATQSSVASISSTPIVPSSVAQSSSSVAPVPSSSSSIASSSTSVESSSSSSIPASSSSSESSSSEPTVAACTDYTVAKGMDLFITRCTDCHAAFDGVISKGIASGADDFDANQTMFSVFGMQADTDLGAFITNSMNGFASAKGGCDVDCGKNIEVYIKSLTNEPICKDPKPTVTSPVDCSTVDIAAGKTSYGTATDRGAGCFACHAVFDEGNSTAAGSPPFPSFDINNPTKYDESVLPLNEYLAANMMNFPNGCDALADETSKAECLVSADNIATYLKQNSAEPYCP